MGDITEIYKEDDTTIKAIDAWYEAVNKPRKRLGLSQVGHKCGRFLWYAHHGTDAIQPEGRVLRLFQLGNILEDQTIIDLKTIGIHHYDCQKEVTFTQDDIKLTGHIDGIVTGLIEAPVTPHLFEHKTCSLKKFKELLSKGYREWNEVYYWQVQVYMLGLKLKRAVAFVYCKDNSELYMERIKLDRGAAIQKMQFVFESISGEPPQRKCPKANWYEARWCNYRNVCFG